MCFSVKTIFYHHVMIQQLKALKQILKNRFRRSYYSCLISISWFNSSVAAAKKNVQNKKEFIYSSLKSWNQDRFSSQGSFSCWQRGTIGRNSCEFTQTGGCCFSSAGSVLQIFENQHIYVTNTFFCSFAKLLFGLDAVTLGSLSSFRPSVCLYWRLLQNEQTSTWNKRDQKVLLQRELPEESALKHIFQGCVNLPRLVSRITLCQRREINCSTVTTWTNSQAVLLAE